MPAHEILGESRGSHRARAGIASGRLRLHHHRPQECKDRGAIAIGVAVGILAKLDVAGPVPLVPNAQALPNQKQQGFWRFSQAGDEQVQPELPFVSAPGRIGDHLDDPGTTWQVLLEVIGRFFRPPRPDGVTAMQFLMISNH